MKLTDIQISRLIKEPKFLEITSPKEINQRTNINPDDYKIIRFNLVLNGIENRFRITWRQHVIYRTNFSIGLMYLPEQRNKGPYLKRYNGNHLGPHKNPIEKTEFQNVCHIHEATERYCNYQPKRGNKKYDIEHYAEPTNKYQTPEEAFRCLLADCNIKYPNNITKIW